MRCPYIGKIYVRVIQCKRLLLILCGIRHEVLQTFLSPSLYSALYYISSSNKKIISCNLEFLFCHFYSWIGHVPTWLFYLECSKNISYKKSYVYTYKILMIIIRERKKKTVFCYSLSLEPIQGDPEAI